MGIDGSRSAIGCGVGCAVAIALAVVLVVIGGSWVRRSFHDVVDAQETGLALVERFGEPDRFAPPPDGVIPADRMEVFLGVREALQQPREELETLFASFPPDELTGNASTARKVLSALSSIKGLINPMGRYVATRNQALLEAGMGPGEYVYIYALAYYALLGHSPEDGPVISKQLPPGAGDRHGSRILDGQDSTFSRDQVRRRYRLILLRILERQLDELEVAEDDGWRTALEAEIARFEAHPARVAWGDGLPPPIRSSLVPYRDRLEATYSSDCNPFEVPLPADQSWRLSD